MSSFALLFIITGIIGAAVIIGAGTTAWTQRPITSHRRPLSRRIEDRFVRCAIRALDRIVSSANR